MKISLLLAGLLLTTNASSITAYCKSEKYQSETRLDGGEMSLGTKGKATFLGINNTLSDNVGVFIFKDAETLIFEYGGEQRHFCKKTAPANWYCTRGILKYTMVCEF